MPASSAIIGKGTLFAYSSDGASYTSIAEVVDVKMPKPTVDDVNVTNYTSPNGYKEFIPGWTDAGEIEFTLNYLKAVTSTLYGLIGVANEYFRITLPDNSTWTFQGYLKHMEGEVPLDNKLSVKATVRVTGKPTFVSGS